MRPGFFILDKRGFFTLNFFYSLGLILFFNLLLLFPKLLQIRLPCQFCSTMEVKDLQSS